MKSVLGFLNPMNVINLVKPVLKKETHSQDNNYNIISIEYVTNSQPAFDKYESHIEQEPYDFSDYKLQDLEDIYLGHYDLIKEFKEKQENNYMDYIVQQDDTLLGIALKYNIDPKKILEINSFSEQMIVPGIKIILPALSNITLNVLHESKQKVQSYFGRNLMDEIMKKTVKTKKCYQVAYLTEIGNIVGTLSINQDIILFNPKINEHNQNLTPNKQENSISKFQACVQIRDIKAVNPIILPTRVSEVGQQSCRDYIIQIVVQKKNKQSPTVKAYFRLMEDQNQQNEEIMHKQIGSICSTVHSLIQSEQVEESEESEEEKYNEDLTLIPFFELQDSSEEELIRMLIQRANLIWGGSSVIPQMLRESNTVTIDQFIQIVSHLPSVFKSGNWDLIYQNCQDGSSMNTLLKNCEQHSPLIMIIKDTQGSVFGAYLTDQITTQLNKFYGAGEAFLFSFKKSSQINVYHWTNKNSDFIYCDHDGIGVGCGEKYGLFVNGDLIQGYSTKCDTFDNEILSDKNDFTIKFMEIWALDQY